MRVKRNELPEVGVCERVCERVYVCVSLIEVLVCVCVCVLVCTEAISRTTATHQANQLMQRAIGKGIVYQAT